MSNQFGGQPIPRGGSSASAAEVQAALQNAVALHQHGQLVEAEQIYRMILQVAPDHFEATRLLGFVLVQRRNFVEGEQLIAQALRINPNDASVLNNRGSALQELKRFEEALASYDKAIVLKPDYAVAFYNRGNVLRELKRFDEALASYDKAIALRPNHAESCNARGIALKELKRFDEALANFDKAIAFKPDYADAFNNQGLVLKELKRFDEAVASFDKAIALKPDYAEAYNNQGNTLQELKRFEEALASYDKAIDLTPDYADAFNDRGVALTELNRFDEAVASFDEAIALKGDDAASFNNRGIALWELKRLGEALASHDQAIALKPDFAEAFCHRGNDLQELKRFEEALTSYAKAITLKPDYAEALLNRGNTLQELRRFEEALASYNGAVMLRPDYAEAHFNEALCRLRIGDFDRGWRKYEWRWQTRQARNDKWNFAQPLWLGSTEITDKAILLHAEQGFGDTIQFCRYVPLVAARAARVILEVPKPLHVLMRSLAGTAQIISTGDPLPDFDVHCPLMSLPLAFGTRLATIPRETPYLAAPECKTRAWRDRLGRHVMPRIGLVWAGNPGKGLPNAHRIDRQRSIAFDRLAPLFQTIECEFYSLQKGEEALAQLQNSALRQRVIDLTDDLCDFADTAALVENLDLIITVDTAVAHLAGALAKPFWLLNGYNTCWRWLLDRDDSPWYPTARLFRQDQTRQWDNLIARVHAGLRDYVRSDRRPSDPHRRFDRDLVGRNLD